MNKIRHIFYLTAFLCCLLLGGCHKPEPLSPSPSPTPTPTPPDPPAKTNYFEADIKDIYAFNCGDISGVEVYYKTDISGWTITPSETWCSILVESSRFVILVSEYKPTINPDGSGGYLYTEPRTCTVTVSAGSVYSKTFTVIQESKTDHTPGGALPRKLRPHRNTLRHITDSNYRLRGQCNQGHLD